MTREKAVCLALDIRGKAALLRQKRLENIPFIRERPFASKRICLVIGDVSTPGFYQGPQLQCHLSFSPNNFRRRRLYFCLFAPRFLYPAANPTKRAPNNARHIASKIEGQG